MRSMSLWVLMMFCLAPGMAWAQADWFSVEVLPPEHKVMTDPVGGAKLTFLTSGESRDTNLYFHQRSWLANGSMILFQSDRDGGGLMGYLTETGELVRLSTAAGALKQVTAAREGARFFAMRGHEVVEFAAKMALTQEPGGARSEVWLKERVICRLPEGLSARGLSENAARDTLAAGYNPREGDEDSYLAIIDITSGEVRTFGRDKIPSLVASHIQWSQTNPHLLSFAGDPVRLWVVDARTGETRNIYEQWPGELVTHEHWWVPTAHGEEQIVFCGGLHEPPVEDAHVKVINVATGEVRILGAGAWWPDGKDEAVAKQNFWHCSGSADGHWVVADNWHGDITVFEGKTTRPRLLTTGHRTYGGGEHPHPGWDPGSTQVIFTSHKLGSPDVCVAKLPEAWRKAQGE